MKETVPDLITLKHKLNEIMGEALATFVDSTESRRAKLRTHRRHTLLSLVFIVAVVVELIILDNGQSSFVQNVLMFFTMIWVVLFVISSRMWFVNTKMLAREMNMAMVPVLTNTLDRMLMYTNSDEHSPETKQLLQESKLMTVDGARIISDDMYSIFGDSEVTIREMQIETTEPTNNGKSSKTVQLFKGVFVTAKLATTNTGETFISTEGDRQGFAHRGFWSDLLESGPVSETVLEWNEFEDNLHVATTDPVAARELLTPEVMTDIYDWWSQHKLHMRIAFRGNQLYMLLPDASIKIGASTTSTKFEAIEKYALSIIQPIWRTLLLVDEVSGK